jgi:Holliday junction resolvase
MGRMQREKGKRGERAFRDLLRQCGFDAERGVQHRGGPNSPDVVCPDLPTLHFEVKAVEALRIWAAIEQAIDDAGGGKVPVVAHKRNNSEWLVFLRAKDFLEIVRRSDLPARRGER